jgi:non-ribosomal peptide synthetase component F
VLEFPIEAEGLARVAALARSRRATPAAVWLAAFEIALWLRTGQTDFLVTLPVSEHDRIDSEAVLGYFTNLGVARARLDATHTRAACVDRVADDLLETLEARAVPFKAVASRGRGAARGLLPALSQVGFNYERLAAGMSFRLGTSLLRPCGMPPRWAKEELKLDVLETPEGARGWLVAERGAFDDEALEDFAGLLFEILEGLLEGPTQPLAQLATLVEA